MHGGGAAKAAINVEESENNGKRKARGANGNGVKNGAWPVASMKYQCRKKYSGQ